MTSVERILQYCHLDQEAPEYTDVRPPSQWPKDGNITLDEVSLTYRQREQPALGPLSLMIKSAQKVKQPRAVCLETIRGATIRILEGGGGG